MCARFSPRSHLSCYYYHVDSTQPTVVAADVVDVVAVYPMAGVVVIEETAVIEVADAFACAERRVWTFSKRAVRL